jgi:plasmid stability protein
MVLPQELISAIKQRASTRGQTVTAYVVELVRRDLGQPLPPDRCSLAEQIRELQCRVERLEGVHPPRG